MFHFLCLITIVVLAGCAGRSKQEDPSTIVSMQVIDRNGFSETISNKDRLSPYQKVNFLTPQPYQKVLRVFGKNQEGKSSSKINSYHSNGQTCQYLEIVDGRAHGKYLEWHENGLLKIETTAIEGIADINDAAKASWLFDGKSSVWDEDGHLVAEIYYDKGSLSAPSRYYYPDGTLKQVIPYEKDNIEGEVVSYYPSGNLLEKCQFAAGLRNGAALGYWENQKVKFEESFENDKLISGTYFTIQGQRLGGIEKGQGKQALFEDGMLSSLIEYRAGAPDGKVELLRKDGSLSGTYQIKDGMKEGEEWEYYSPKKAGELKPKLCLHWHEDALQGQAKTWYDNGILESQREISGSKKQGLSFAWYKSGALMLSEEYENDLLIKGSYYKKGDKNAVSHIEEGKGTATLHTPEGLFLKKISYDKGLPHLEDAH